MSDGGVARYNLFYMVTMNSEFLQFSIRAHVFYNKTDLFFELTAVADRLQPVVAGVKTEMYSQKHRLRGII